MSERYSENFQMMAVKLSLIIMTVYGPSFCTDNTLYVMQGVDNYGNKKTVVITFNLNELHISQ